MGKKIAYVFIVLLIILAAVGIYLINPLEKKTKSGLQVITTDIPASLFLNDEYLADSPYISRDLPPGKYELRIVPDDERLAVYETQISLNKGLIAVVIWKPGETFEKSSGVIYELEALADKNQTEISFVTTPDNSIIHFADEEQLFSPTLLKDVEPGRHQFQINLPSYEAQENTVNAVAGHRLNISVKLARLSPVE